MGHLKDGLICAIEAGELGPNVRVDHGDGEAIADRILSIIRANSIKRFTVRVDDCGDPDCDDCPLATQLTVDRPRVGYFDEVTESDGSETHEK